eukprot:gnl/TRDRNA2_/TRDRNA2_171310_c1_seq2.p1 gnl/TRDRNA2_/TRDRNA2_171310_c1~~gnl/TRDRNA2_/TRDRNA2_171310_c1_seq2.p1  ORF type:complete len:189 (+),score=17.31 gnl/TRDRNA2_/TRDRNA2_171310_c1_seq2:97-663(+)
MNEAMNKAWTAQVEKEWSCRAKSDRARRMYFETQKKDAVSAHLRTTRRRPLHDILLVRECLLDETSSSSGSDLSRCGSAPADLGTLRRRKPSTDSGHSTSSVSRAVRTGPNQVPARATSNGTVMFWRFDQSHKPPRNVPSPCEMKDIPPSPPNPSSPEAKRLYRPGQSIAFGGGTTRTMMWPEDMPVV